MRPPWPWLRRYWPVTLLVAAGLFLIVAGLLEKQDSIGRIAIGAGLLLIGVFADRIRRAKFGVTGAEIELEERVAESTTELSEAEATETVVTGTTVLVTKTPFPASSFPDPEQVIDVHRVALASDVFTMLTQPRQGPLVNCVFQLYLYDADEHMLLPALEPGHARPSPAFRVGEGVAGTAWRSGEFVIAEGPEVSDGTFSLSADKQARYADLSAVAAMPVTNAAGEVIAVLSASSTDPESGLTTEEGFESLVALADSVARVLVDLLKWFSDGYDDE